MSERPLRYLDGAQIAGPEREQQDERSYLAGYFDVSGTIAIVHVEAHGFRKEDYLLTTRLARVEPTVVGMFREGFPAGESSHTLPSGKVVSLWYAYEGDAAHMLARIGDDFIVHQPQLALARQFLMAKAEGASFGVLEDFRQKMSDLNHQVAKPVITQPLKPAYMAGIMDAHGSYTIRQNDKGIYSPYVKLAIAECPALVTAMRAQYRKLSISGFTPDSDAEEPLRAEMKLSNNVAKWFLEDLLPHLRVTKRLAELMIAFQTDRNTTRTVAERAARWRREAAIVEEFYAENRRVRPRFAA